jgi:hypothetical protein
MFEVEKPRQFHYVPRFYDPEKEKWEALKKKYAIEQEKRAAESETHSAADGESDAELEYFQRRVRDINRENLAKSSQLTWRDLFRKREMPKFNYQPRFSSEAQTSDEAKTDKINETDAQDLATKYWQAKRQIKIRRRFDISDSDYMKPISGTKIVLYGFIAFILILVIIAF